MNILIVKLSAIGDVIHTLPALNALRNYYPNANITWLVEEDAAPLVQGHKALNHVLVSKRKHWLKALRSLSFLSTIKEIFGFIKALRDTRYDMILDFQALLKSGILIALARGRRKIGFGKGLEHMEHSYIFLNEHVPAVDMEIHALSRGMMLLNAVGIPTNEVEYKLPVSNHDRKKIDELMKQHGINDVKSLIAINHVAKWETKLWPNKKFAELADMLIDQYDMKIVFTGGIK
ncbi:MAG: lipopolysaccharide heptosyltransferase I, partial [Desulfobacteraceae bacterium]